jgi:hypothetical protein
MLTDHQNKTLLESEINRAQQAVDFLRSVPSTAYFIDQERREKEMRLASLKFQLKRLTDRLDSQICI